MNAPMTLRDAALATADLFDAHPELYDHNRTTVPAEGQPGCAQGQVASLMGTRPGSPLLSAEETTGLLVIEFCAAMDRAERKSVPAGSSTAWRKDARMAAFCLRKLAETLS
jgi:hypothetical protein